MYMMEAVSPVRVREQTHLPWMPALLERYRHYSTRSLSDLQGRIRQRWDVGLSVGRSEDFISYSEMRLTMGQLVLGVGCIEAQAGYDLSFGGDDKYIIDIPRRGAGWVSTGDICVEYGFGDIMIVSPFCRVSKHWDGPGETISIKVPAQSFDAAVEKFGLGALPAAPIFRIEGRRLRSFFRVLEMICSELQDSDGPSPFLHAPLSDQIEQVLLTLLLEGVKDDVGAKVEATPASPALPYYVRRAEKFVAANAHLQIGMDELASASGVSTRALQYGFRAFLDTTPMQYLKRVRYERARALLLSGRCGRKIRDIAAEIGCANLSQFSRDYRSVFGETPSDTLATIQRRAA